MVELDVAIVGTGPDPTSRDRTGFAMAYRHAQAYREHTNCDITACVDIEPDHAAAFGEYYDLPDAAVFTDHDTMLREAQPDVISICVPPSAHAEIVRDCANAPTTRAIHCEKPMATRWDDCQEMVATCAEQNVQLTIDHQRRFARPVVRAKSLIEDDAIGAVRRLEWSEVNLFDAGSHVFDLCDYFVGGSQPSWVLGAIDTSEHREWFGTVNSNRSIVHWAYNNGVQGIASTADGGETAVDAYLRIIGENGTIEIQPQEGPPLQMRTTGGWEKIATDGESLYGPRGSKLKGVIKRVQGLTPGESLDLPDRPNYARAIDHAIDCLLSGHEPTISGATALRSTELIFGAWGSAHNRSRIEFPIGNVGNPFEQLTTERTRVAPDPA